MTTTLATADSRLFAVEKCRLVQRHAPDDSLPARTLIVKNYQSARGGQPPPVPTPNQRFPIGQLVGVFIAQPGGDVGFIFSVLHCEPPFCPVWRDSWWRKGRQGGCRRSQSTLDLPRSRLATVWEQHHEWELTLLAAADVTNLNPAGW